MEEFFNELLALFEKYNIDTAKIGNISPRETPGYYAVNYYRALSALASDCKMVGYLSVEQKGIFSQYRTEIASDK